MATPFDLPNLDSEQDRVRALGVKNSGVKEFSFDRVFPVNRLNSQDGSLVGGKVLEFRIRSDSNRWINWRETKIQATFEVKVLNAGTEAAQGGGFADDPDYLTQISQDTRIVACPLHATFDGGMSYTLNSQLVENNTHPHQSAMIALHTRTDAFDVQTTGSGSLMSLEKTTNYPNLRATYAAGTALTHGQDRRLVNPKVAVLQDFFDSTTGEDKATFQVAEPLLGLASLQHGYFAPPGDHRIELTVANGFESHLFFNHLSGTGDLFDAISSEPFPTTSADKQRLAKTLIVNLKDIELSVCMVSPAGASYIPRGVALKFSPYMITHIPIQSRNVLTSCVVPPATRAVYLWMRQQHASGPDHDFEELGLATMGINIHDHTNASKKVGYFEQLEVQLGASIAGRYTQMNPRKGLMQRPWNDYLSTIGKPNALRGSQLTYGEYCGVANEQVAGAPATGEGSNAIVANGNVIMPGRTCGGFYMRIINPSGNLSNMLQIRGDLNTDISADSQLELVVCAVSDRLLQCEYAEGQEIPVSTRVTDIL